MDAQETLWISVTKRWLHTTCGRNIFPLLEEDGGLYRFILPYGCVQVVVIQEKARRFRAPSFLMTVNIALFLPYNLYPSSFATPLRIPSIHADPCGRGGARGGDVVYVLYFSGRMQLTATYSSSNPYQRTTNFA